MIAMLRLRVSLTVVALAAAMMILYADTQLSAAVFFRDDFNGSLSSAWSIERPDASYYSLQSTCLDLRTSWGDLWSNNNTATNVFLINNPTMGDFNVTVHLNSFVPTSYTNAPQFDILAFDNDDNHVRCGYGCSGLNGYQRCTQLVSETNASPTYGGTIHDFGSSSFYLRLQKVGSSYTQFYSTDGTNFLQAGTPVTFGDGTPTKLGFVAMVDQYQSSHAYLDYFEVTTAVEPSTWAVNADGNWSTSTNWTGTPANGAGSIALLGSAITTPHTVTLDSGKTVGTLMLDNTKTYTVAGPGTLTIQPSSGNASISVLSGSHAISAPIKLAGPLDVQVNNSASTLTISSAIGDDGSRSLNKLGDGSLILTGNNTYKGGTCINGGTLQASSDASLGAASSTLSFDGGTLVARTAGIASARNVTLNAGGGTVNTNGSSCSFSGPIIGVGGLTKAGAGVLTLTGQNTFSGPITVTGGSLVGNTASLPRTISLSNQANVTFNQTTVGTVNNTIAGTGSLTKTGTAVLNLGAVCTYNGPTTISEGTLRLSGPSGSTTLPVSGEAYWLDASNPQSVSGTSVTQWKDLSGNNRNFTVGSASPPTLVQGAMNGLPVVRFDGATNSLTYSGSVTAQTVFIVTKPTRFSGGDGIWGQSGADLGIRLYDPTQWSGKPDSTSSNSNDYTNAGISGGTYLTTAGTFDVNTCKFGSIGTPQIITAYGNSTFANTAIGQYYPWYDGRWYQGDIAEVIVFNSTLDTSARRSVEQYLQSKWLTGSILGGSLPNSSAVTIASGATLDVNGVTQVIGSLAGSGNVSLGNGTLTTGGDNTSTLFSGAISSSGTPAVSLVKTGSGVMTLTGTNTYTGRTTIGQGKLAVDGSLVSSITVENGGTLSGIGTVGMVTVNSGGQLAPGNSIGTLTLTGDLLLAKGAKVDFELGAPGTSDMIAMTSSTLTLDKQDFSDFMFTPQAGFGPGEYVLIDAGTIQGNLEVASGMIHDLPATLSIIAISGGHHDLVLKVVPEPGTLVLLGAGALGLMAYAWRRQKPAATRQGRRE